MARQQEQWTISRIRGNKAEHLGVVVARTAEDAVRKAIKEFQITDPKMQKRIAARPGLAKSSQRAVAAPLA
jgi:hypothetical protein